MSLQMHWSQLDSQNAVLLVQISVSVLVSRQFMDATSMESISSPGYTVNNNRYVGIFFRNSYFQILLENI